VEEKPVNLATERLVRQAPADRPLMLDQGDVDYILACLAAIRASFGVEAVPDQPLTKIPGRDLMRRLVDFRANLRPQTDERRDAWAHLASAIMRLEVASAFAAEWGRRKD